MGTTTIDGSTVADPGGMPRGPCPPSPVQTSHKKDGRQRRPHRFHVSWPPPQPVARSDADPGIFSIGLLSPYYKKIIHP